MFVWCYTYLTFALQEWYVEKVKAFCRVPSVSGDVCAALLSPLDVDDVTNIMEDPGFPLVHTCTLCNVPSMELYVYNLGRWRCLKKVERIF